MGESLTREGKQQHMQRYRGFWNDATPRMKSLEDSVGWGKEGRQ